MRSIFALACLLVSFSAFARQYIQCSITDTQSTDVMVVNLQTPEGGTLFLSSGMQNPEDERILVKIAFDKVEGAHHLFKVTDGLGTAHVAVPSAVLNQSSNFLIVRLVLDGQNYEYSCFSRIYND